MKPDRLFLIDGHSFIYRAYFAIRSLSTSKGQPTNAIYGFTNMLIKVVREKQPDFFAVVFDSKGPTHRHQEYAAYKAQRPEMPDTLSQQVPFIHRIVSAFRIPLLMMEGYEADDLIGTLAKQAEQKGFDITIVTGDKDLFQLISPRIRIYDSMKDKIYDSQDVQERFGVEPERIPEIMGLMGDTIDNIPGVPGIGEKTAIKLVQQFHTIDNLLGHLDQVRQHKLQETLYRHKDLAKMSRQLVTLQLDCPIQTDLSHLKRTAPDMQELMDLFQQLEFHSLLKRVEEMQGANDRDTVQGKMGRGNSHLSSSKIITDIDALAGLIKRAQEVKRIVIQPWPILPWEEKLKGSKVKKFKTTSKKESKRNEILYTCCLRER